ncbi:MAG: hypothetical protein ACFBZ8_03225 [Opitutales bacterium]
MSQKIIQDDLEYEKLQPEQQLADDYGQAIEQGQPMEVILRSPMGLRGAFDISGGRLEIWISPQAKNSTDADLRNFSNRDDHTRVFDQISFPGLKAEHFQSCDYDPFHSVLHFADAQVHLVALVDAPGFLLWSQGRPLVVDLKTDKADTLAQRDPQRYVSQHPDRGLTFIFAAVAGEGATFVLPPEAFLASGRSAYTRIELEPGQPLLIGGELQQDDPTQTFADLASKGVEAIVEVNERAVTAGTANLRAVFRNKPDWQRQFDLNLRVLFSAQDHGGWIPAAFRSLYYLCWHFDGSIISTWLGMMGWPAYLERWAAFEIGNPTETDTPVPGKFFGQLVTRRISKQEEWGWYTAVSSAFAHYTQTGSRQFCEGTYRDHLIAAFDWLERLCYDCEWGAFGTWYQGEDPFMETHDFGFDAAVGKPMNLSAPSHRGRVIRRKFGFADNNLIYNGCWMMAVMLGEGSEAERFRERAEQVGHFLRRCHAEQVDRYLIFDGGEIAKESQPPYHEMSGFFQVAPETTTQMVRSHPLRRVELLRDGAERFAHQMFHHFLQGDPALIGTEDITGIVEIFLPQCAREGRYLRMPGTVIENINCEDGSYHDNRPQIFATSLMNVCMLATCLRRQAFGYAVRASPYVERIENVAYRGQLLNFVFLGKGAFVERIEAGAHTWQRTWQLPEHLGDAERLKIQVLQTEAAPAKPVWIGSTVRLRECNEAASKPSWRFEAIGCNHVCFLGPRPDIRLLQEGQEVAFDLNEADGAHFLSFEGRGVFELRLGE